jgi:hypothetical protein
MTLPVIYTLTEAAQRMRTNKNALARLARRNGHCSTIGRALLFSEADLAALWEAMRVPATSPRQATPLEKNIEERAAAFLSRKSRP